MAVTGLRTGSGKRRRIALNMKRILVLLLVLITFLTGAAAESVLPDGGTSGKHMSGSTVIFVGTDRHAAYETIRADTDGAQEVAPPGGTAS